MEQSYSSHSGRKWEKKGKDTRIPVSFQGHTRGDVTPFLLGPILPNSSQTSTSSLTYCLQEMLKASAILLNIIQNLNIIHISIQYSS